MVTPRVINSELVVLDVLTKDIRDLAVPSCHSFREKLRLMRSTFQQGFR
jgi:hypothetical protein